MQRATRNALVVLLPAACLCVLAYFILRDSEARVADAEAVSDAPHGIAHEENAAPSVVVDVSDPLSPATSRYADPQFAVIRVVAEESGVPLLDAKVYAVRLGERRGGTIVSHVDERGVARVNTTTVRDDEVLSVAAPSRLASALPEVTGGIEYEVRLAMALPVHVSFSDEEGNPVAGARVFLSQSPMDLSHLAGLHATVGSHATRGLWAIHSAVSAPTGLATLAVSGGDYYMVAIHDDLVCIDMDMDRKYSLRESGPRMRFSMRRMFAVLASFRCKNDRSIRYVSYSSDHEGLWSGAHISSTRLLSLAGKELHRRFPDCQIGRVVLLDDASGAVGWRHPLRVVFDDYTDVRSSVEAQPLSEAKPLVLEVDSPTEKAGLSVLRIVAFAGLGGPEIRVPWNGFFGGPSGREYPVRSWSGEDVSVPAGRGFVSFGRHDRKLVDRIEVDTVAGERTERVVHFPAKSRLVTLVFETPAAGYVLDGEVVVMGPGQSRRFSTRRAEQRMTLECGNWTVRWSFSGIEPGAHPFTVSASGDAQITVPVRLR